MYRQIFASLRKIMAWRRFDNVYIGDFMVGIVLDKYIEPLQNAVEETTDEKETRMYKKRIKEWQKYLDVDLWNTAAINIVVSRLRKEPRQHIQETEDIIQDMAVVLQEDIKRNRTFRSRIDPLDMNKKPSSLIKLFKSIISNRVKNHFDSLHRDWKKKTRGYGTTGRPEGTSEFLDTQQAPAYTSPSVMRGMYKGLEQYLKRTRDSIDGVIFEAWMAAAKRPKTGRPFANAIWRDLNEDVLDEDGELIKERQINMTYQAFLNRWEKIERTIGEYFKEELGYELSPALKKRLKISAANAIVTEYSRRLLARYVLGGVHEKYLSGNFASPEFMVQQILRERKRRK